MWSKLRLSQQKINDFHTLKKEAEGCRPTLTDGGCQVKKNGLMMRMTNKDINTEIDKVVAETCWITRCKNQTSPPFQRRRYLVLAHGRGVLWLPIPGLILFILFIKMSNHSTARIFLHGYGFSWAGPSDFLLSHTVIELGFKSTLFISVSLWFIIIARTKHIDPFKVTEFPSHTFYWKMTFRIKKVFHSLKKKEFEKKKKTSASALFSCEVFPHVW